jgi:hypothetical protein
MSGDFPHPSMAVIVAVGAWFDALITNEIGAPRTEIQASPRIGGGAAAG